MDTAYRQEPMDTGLAWYRALSAAAAEADVAPAFDIHVAASILALSFDNAQAQNQPLALTAGYEDTAELIRMFPAQRDWLIAGLAPMKRSAEEKSLLELLWRGASRHDAYEALIARMMARRAQYPNHLWQDLGLNDRGELSRLMQTHFAPLAARNTNDMKWKNFFFRLMCGDAGYALCAAPSCSECSDFDVCFGDESGMSLLAKTRRKADRAE